MFKLNSHFKPTGDQPQAIRKLVQGLRKGFKYQTLLGVTGSGKTFTMANVIYQTQRPALILSPNKVLAAQLYQEFRYFFPENAVHYFVSYYDYYQPEAYLPETDTYIAKDARINELLDQLRHAAIESVLTRKDFIVVSSISCIYGIGDPEEYKNICLNLKVGQNISLKEVFDYLKTLQYERGSFNEIKAGTYIIEPRINTDQTQINTDKSIYGLSRSSTVHGLNGSNTDKTNNIYPHKSVSDPYKSVKEYPHESALDPRRSALYIFNPDGSFMLEITWQKKLIEKIKRFKIKKSKEDVFKLEITGDYEDLDEVKIFPAKFFVTPKEKLDLAILNIKQELKEQYWKFLKEGKIVEAERIRQRTLLDISLLEKYGYCPGIENYSRHLSFRQPGDPPYTLLDYLPPETILFIDESHLALPQLRAMAHGDRRRKETLVEYGWRLPSAIDNRPLTFNEFFAKNFQMIFVSATPGKHERKISSQVVEQLVRPTGILDPEIEVRPTKNQVVDLLKEIKLRTERNQRILVLTLTKRSAENLTEFLLEQGIKATYLHSDIKTLRRAEIIKKLRTGEIEVLVGVNLLREGLDLPEVSLVAILDADREGFLRNTTTLIQAIGRSARHLEGKVILYADKLTKSLKSAIKETERRRKYQMMFNKKNKIKPKPIVKDIFITPLEILGKSHEEIVSKEELEIFVEIKENEL
jgi:excinuclease ABC subunit B